MTSTASNKFLRPEAPQRTGTCRLSPFGILRCDQRRLCGGRGRALRILVIGDFTGWACEECHRELGKSLPRRYVPAGEQTETSE